MKASTLQATVIVTAAAASHTIVAIAAGLAVLALVICTGVALPAVWSRRATRRQAAADVLRQILGLLRR